MVVCLSIALVVGGCADKETGPAEDKDEIVIGAARSYTGPLSIQDVSCFGPVYRMWIDEVNERGGIYVEEYGKKLPVRLIKYDDTSDMNTMTNLLKKLMVEDQVDFVLAPISTAFLKAAAQICNDHGYILIGAEGGAKELEPLMAEMPYFFCEEGKAKKAQALLCCAYPDENFGVMNECMAADYNPDVLLFGPGACFEVFYNIYGEATEGVMGWGAWNENSSTALKDLAERLIAHQGERNMDWWGMAIYYAGLQVLEQAIEKAGTLDHDVLKDVIATEKFDTVIGELWFENGGVPAECYPGQVGQWQDGIFEVVAPSDKTTADPMIPKPKWPSK